MCVSVCVCDCLCECVCIWLSLCVTYVCSLMKLLLPTLLAACYNLEDNCEVLEQVVSGKLLCVFLQVRKWKGERGKRRK